MDFITPGLRPRGSQSQTIIDEINANSKISVRLRRRFRELNAQTNDLVVANYKAQAPASTHQTRFEELYTLLGIDNFKFSRVTKVDIAKLSKLYDSEGVSVEVSPDPLGQLMDTYAILVALQTLSNSLIFKTLILKSNLVYWEDMYNSRFNKVVYFVQTAPQNFVHFAKQLSNNFVPSSHATVTSAGTEEDHLIHNLWVRAVAFARYAHQTISKVFVFNNPSVFLRKKGTFHYLKNVAGFPQRLVNREISAKIGIIRAQIEELEGQIDALIKVDVSHNDACMNVVGDILGTERSVPGILSSLAQFSSAPDPASEQPSFVVRYWPLLVVLLRFGPGQGLDLYRNREEVVLWIKHNLVDTVVGFFRNWLIKPIGDMLSVLRQDEDFTITSKESLKSDLDSLERMLVEFLRDQSVPLDEQQVHEAVQNGNLTLLMSRYEDEIRSPIKSLLKGSLIRSLLIQVQKGKVDGSLAINGIDKLLKSQQLVFGFVSLSPSLFIVYKLWDILSSSKPLMINGKQANMLCLRSLNKIENLLVLWSRNADKNQEGKLLLEIINLIITSKGLIPKQLRKDWVSDLNELNNVDYDVDMKLNLVRKIWNVYGGYFR